MRGGRSRTAADGTLVPLEEQDRTLWDRALIDEGTRGRWIARWSAGGQARTSCRRPSPRSMHVPRARRTPTGRRSPRSTERCSGTPGPHRRAERGGRASRWPTGPEAGLEWMERLERSGALDGYHLLPAAQADLLRRLGRAEEATRGVRPGAGAGAPSGRAEIPRASSRGARLRSARRRSPVSSSWSTHGKVRAGSPSDAEHRSRSSSCPPEAPSERRHDPGARGAQRARHGGLVRPHPPANLLEGQPLQDVEREEVAGARLERRRAPPPAPPGPRPAPSAAEQRQPRDRGPGAASSAMHPVSGSALRHRLEQVQRHPHQDGAEPGIEAAAALVFGELRRPGTRPAAARASAGAPRPAARRRDGAAAARGEAAPAAVRPAARAPRLVSLERRADEVEVRHVDRDAIRLQRRDAAGRRSGGTASGSSWKVRVRVPRDLERITELDHAGGLPRKG